MIHHRNYKNFDESLFLNDLEKATFLTNSNCPNKNYQHLTENFLSVVEKHTPRNKKIVTGNQAQFVNRKFTLELDYETNTGKTQHQKMNFATNNKEINVFLLGKKHEIVS